MSRTVAITGVSGGIGRATAAAFIAEGWTVLGSDVQQPPADLKLAAFLPLDLSGPDVEDRMAEFLASYARLDSLVNGAALGSKAALVDTGQRVWDEVMATNARGAFLTSKAAFGLLWASEGAVVNIASVHALATSAGAGVYAASKGALVALTRSMALEWAPAIRVNAVIPGAVDTPMLRSGLADPSPLGSEDKALEDLARRTPLQRIGTADEIAQAVLFLADRDRSSFVTGQTLVVDGGALARLSTE